MRTPKSSSYNVVTWETVLYGYFFAAMQQGLHVWTVLV